MRIFSIKDPYNPTVVGVAPVGDTNFSGVAISPDLATMYVAAALKGMYIYNISDLTNPKLISTYAPLDPLQYAN